MIHFICALKCEASPIIKYYDLKHLTDARLFRIYVNDKTGISLTVTGVGKLAATGGVIYSYAELNCEPGDVWLNLGVAGHREHAIGDIFLSSHIEDSASSVVWYPQIVIDTEIPTEKLLTLDQPSTKYVDAMFDMEASGFISAASRVSAGELVHSIKIISDNQDNPAGKFKKSTVSNLIELNMEQIVTLSSQLETLAKQLQINTDVPLP